MQENYSKIIDLIYKNAQQSIADIDSSINTLNTKLSALTGFDALLIKLVNDLPGKLHAIEISNASYGLPCYSCLLLKVLACFFLAVSLLISLKALLPKKGNDKIIAPSEQVEKCLELTDEEYKLLFIDLYDEDIQSLVALRNWKSQRLNWAGEALVGATAVAILDIVLASSFG
jgi:hypothetical protein